MEGRSWGGGFAQWPVSVVAGIKMTIGVLGCRCTQRAREVTLAMVAAAETSPAICLGP